MSGNATTGQRVLKEVPHVGDITKEDIEQYAEHLGIKLPDEHHLLWIAQAGLEVSLPPPWCPVEDTRGRIYYYNSATKETIWEHPLDSYYKDMVKKERSKVARVVKDVSAVEKTFADSGTSLMSSADDVPPISTYVKPLDSGRSGGHPSLQRGEKRHLFPSRSCPSDLHVVSQKESLSWPESRSATLKPARATPPSVKELQSQKQTLLLELEQLKAAVEKYRRLREQLRASAEQEALQKTSESHSEKRNASERRYASDDDASIAGDNPRSHVPKLQVVSLGERGKTHFLTLPPRLKRHVSHADLTRISERLRQLRQRHLQLTMRAAEQVSDEALAGSIVAQAAYHSSLNKEFVPLLKAATASLSRRSSRALEAGDAPDPRYASTLPCLAKRSSWSQGTPVEDGSTSRREWMKKLSELRMGVEECRLHQLLIK